MTLVNGVKLMGGRKEIEVTSSGLLVHLYVSIGNAERNEVWQARIPFLPLGAVADGIVWSFEERRHAAEFNTSRSSLLRILG